MPVEFDMRSLLCCANFFFRYSNRKSVVKNTTTYNHFTNPPTKHLYTIKNTERHFFYWQTTDWFVYVCWCVFVVWDRKSTHPFVVLPSVSQHLLQGPYWQGLLQHKVTNTQVWRNILQDGGKERRGKRGREGGAKGWWERNISWMKRQWRDGSSTGYKWARSLLPLKFLVSISALL